MGWKMCAARLVGRVTPCAPPSAQRLPITPIARKPDGAHGVTRPTFSSRRFLTQRTRRLTQRNAEAGFFLRPLRKTSASAAFNQGCLAVCSRLCRVASSLAFSNAASESLRRHSAGDAFDAVSGARNVGRDFAAGRRVKPLSRIHQTQHSRPPFWPEPETVTCLAMRG